MSGGLATVLSSALDMGAALTTAPSPSPTPSTPDELQVTPGLVGFLATFALAAVCVLLFLSLTRHLRRAGQNARRIGVPVEEPTRKGFGPEGAADAAGTPDAGTSDAGRPDAGPGTDGADGSERSPL